ncbi:hypothetical protein BH11PLA2_BH11PLA2_13020 [soil metagenome]
MTRTALPPTPTLVACVIWFLHAAFLALLQTMVILRNPGTSAVTLIGHLVCAALIALFGGGSLLLLSGRTHLLVPMSVVSALIFIGEFCIGIAIGPRVGDAIPCFILLLCCGSIIAAPMLAHENQWQYKRWLVRRRRLRRDSE